MADKKRKGADTKTPAKKRKVETPKSSKSTPKNSNASPSKKVTSTKVKKPELKKTPAKAAAKSPAKKTKTPAKVVKKTPQKKVVKSSPVKKVVPKPAPKKVEKKAKSAASSVTRAKLVKAKSPATKMKMQLAKSLKAKATAAAKSKLKTTKAASKVKAVKKTPVKPEPSEKKDKTPAKKPDLKADAKKSEQKSDNKKPEPKAEFKKPDEKKKETPKSKAVEKKTEKKPESASKRKNTEQTEDELPRKRRMITPNKKFADYELEVPSKRTITPNKKYADYETDTPAKKEKSELRSFIQDKKKTPATTEGKSEPTKADSPKKAVPEKTDTPSREITVLKPSEMKPAEKLMKKLQKKLEKEAKSASVPKPSENREKAKIKITKVVTYDKPMSSDEKEMRAINKASKSPSRPKTDIAKKKVEAVVQKTPKTPNDKQAIGKVIKSTPKSTTKTVKPPEKLPPKPKKIKELRKEERPIQAKFVCSKSVKLPDDNDKVQCWVTGISVFPSGEVIMVDMANRKIKLFSKDFEFLSQVKLETIPQDISISPVNASNAYFTKPFSKEGIQKVSMSDGKLTLNDSFWTNGTNRGITCTKAGILTSVQDGRYHDLDINHFKIDLLDYEGKVLQSVSTDSNGSRLFKLPLYFTVNSTGKQVIVADCIKHLSYVVSVDMTGKIRFKYDGINNNLVTPRGLTIDDEDNIYVTEWERHNVYILSPAGKRLQILFSNEELREEGLDGLQKPYQLCFYKRDNARQLLVSQEGCNTVKLFKLLKKGPETEAAAAEAKAAAEKKSLPNGEAKSTNTKIITKKSASPTKEVQSKPINEGRKQVISVPVKVAMQNPPKETPVLETKKPVVRSTVSESTQVTDLPEPADTEESVEPAEEPPAIVAKPIEIPVEQNETHTVQQEAVTVTVPIINPEFGSDFGTAENETEEMPAVQNAIESLNDSKENQMESEPIEENQMESEPIEENQMESEPIAAPINTNEIQVQIYDPVNVPQTEMVSIIPQHQINEAVIEQPQEMEVQQVELVSSEYQEEISIPQVEMTQSVIGTEIHAVPVESVGHQTIVYEQSVDEEPTQYIVTVSDNSANGVLQSENVQYVTSIQDENYATSIAQGETVTEIPEDMVTIVTETV